MSYHYDPVTNTFSGISQTMESLGQVMWHITDHCRLNCAICFTKKMRKHHLELPVQEIVPHIALLKKIGVQKIDISGGEPLLYEFLPCLVEHCAAQSISVTLTTSGTGLPDITQWVSKHHQLFARVIVSLDGPRELHNKLRGRDYAYSAFEQFSLQLKENGCQNLRINTVLTNECTFGDACEELCMSVIKISPLEWCLIEPFPINKTEFYSSLAPKREEYELFYAECVQHLAGSDIRIIRRTNEDYSSYWSLFPDGYLYYSHDNNTYDTKILFDVTHYCDICSAVAKTNQTYIKIEKEPMQNETYN